MKTPIRWTRMLAFAPLAALATLAGCGGDGIDNVSQRAEQQAMDTPTHVIRATEAEVAHAVSASKGAAAQAVTADGAPVASGALPPDIAVSVPDTLVQPGQTVELTVHGTPDISELVLWDGLNDRQAFTREPGPGDAWSVIYRVPLRPMSERIGLSVTARNEAGRWHRRWVFLKVGSVTQSPAQAGESEPKAGEGKSGTMDSSGT